MFDILAEHVGQALAVQHTLGRLKGLSKGLATALEHLPQAAVLLGRDGRLLHANSAAVNVLYDADGLEVKQGRLEATLPEARASLGKLLQEAFQDLARRVAFKRRVAAVSRPSGRRAYLIRVFPIDQALEYVELDDLNGDPYLVMLITESEAAGPVLSTEELQVVYGLTPTEAAVAAALARGHSLSEIAARKDIAVDTVRKQLQSIFQKTGTHRQAALVHRLVVDLAMG